MRPDFFWMGGMWIFPMMMFGIMIIIMFVILFSIFSKNKKIPCNIFQKDNSPLDILKMRYAKGEISKEEFEQMKVDIHD